MRLFNSNYRFRSTGSGSSRKVIALVLFCVTALTAFGAVSQAPTYIIAHFPLGGGWSTRLVFENNGSADVTADVSFFTQTGTVGSVPLEGQQGLQSSQHIVIGRGQVATLNADPTQRNAGPLVVMWAKVTATGPLDILSLFDSSAPATVPTTVPATLITGAVGAQSTTDASSFRFPVSVSGPLHYNAGLAVANPNPTAANFTVFLFNADRTLNHSLVMSLQANSQTSFVVSDPTIFGNNIDLSSPFVFDGSIAVCATQPLGLVAIGIEGGALYTIPVHRERKTTDPCPLM